MDYRHTVVTIRFFNKLDFEKNFIKELLNLKYLVSTTEAWKSFNKLNFGQKIIKETIFLERIDE